MKSISFFLLLLFLSIAAEAQLVQTFDGDFCTGLNSCWTLTGSTSAVGRSPLTAGNSICYGAIQNTTTPITGTGSLNKAGHIALDGGEFLTAYNDVLSTTGFGVDGDSISFQVRFNQIAFDTASFTVAISVTCGSFSSVHYYTPADEDSTYTIHEVVSGSGGGGTIIVNIFGFGYTGVPFDLDYDLDEFRTTAVLDLANPCLDIVLPVALATFSGKATAGGNTLTWTTADDHTCTAFEVQRRHTDGTFRTIGTVESQRSTTGATYHFTDSDRSPGASCAYYRLELKEQASRPVYSDIIGVRYGPAPAIEVYPSLVVDQLTIHGLTPLDRIDLLNSLGQTVTTQVATRAYETLDLTGLLSAVYTVVVTSFASKEPFFCRIAKQ